jgi:hypothetical protein
VFKGREIIIDLEEEGVISAFKTMRIIGLTQLNIPEETCYFSLHCSALNDHMTL